MSRTNVRLSSPPGARGDSAAQAHARVYLKLSALAYAAAGHRSTSPDPRLAAASAATLCRTAALYYEALAGRRLPREDDGGDSDARLSSGRLQLLLAALAYDGSRHGADACVEFTRIAIGNLCMAAIRYCEVLDGEDPKRPPVVDRMLELDDGA